MLAPPILHVSHLALSVSQGGGISAQVATVTVDSSSFSSCSASFVIAYPPASLSVVLPSGDSHIDVSVSLIFFFSSAVSCALLSFSVPQGDDIYNYQSTITCSASCTGYGTYMTSGSCSSPVSVDYYNDQGSGTCDYSYCSSASTDLSLIHI